MVTQVEMDNPYGTDLFMVTSPTGSTLYLPAEEEAKWYENQRDKYLGDLKFTNTSDLEDLSRLLTLEIMIYRWSAWITQGFDYFATKINENDMKNNIKEYCVDEDTEILTKRGWKRYTDIIPGELVLALDTISGMSKWTPLKNIYTFYPSEPLFSYETRDHSSLTTKNHRWWTRYSSKSRSYKYEDRWETSETISSKYSWVPTVAPHADFDLPKYSDDFVELVAWWWTEGYCDKRMHNGEIGQLNKVNPDKVISIREALNREFGEPGNLRTGFLWNETHKKDGMVLFNLSTKLVCILW